MRSSTFRFTSADGRALFEKSKAAVQIAHGLVEHAGRHARLAKALTDAGYGVYGGDHRGHELQGILASLPRGTGAANALTIFGA